MKPSGTLCRLCNALVIKKFILSAYKAGDEYSIGIHMIDTSCKTQKNAAAPSDYA